MFKWILGIFNFGTHNISMQGGRERGREERERERERECKRERGEK